MPKKCDESGECETHPDVKVHMLVCSSFQRVFAEKYAPFLEEQIVDKKVSNKIMALLVTLFLGGSATIGAVVASVVKSKMEETKTEIIDAVEKRLMKNTNVPVRIP